MISEADFISFRYTPDLTLAGLAYACKRLHLIESPDDRSKLKDLKKIVAEVGIELGFRRHLIQTKIPHTNLKAKPFTDPDRYEIALGGRRCKIISFILTRKNMIRRVRKNPRALLETKVRVSRDQSDSVYLTPEDIYLFAYLTTLVTPNFRTLQRAIQANQPIFLIHLPPLSWSRPSRWGSLGELIFESSNSQLIKLEVNGLDRDRRLLTETIRIDPEGKTQTTLDFYTLTHISTAILPEGNIRSHCASLGSTDFIQPANWDNLWVYGIQIIFAGYLTRGDYHSRVLQKPGTNTDTTSVPIPELKPLSSLFEHARSWRNV